MQPLRLARTRRRCTCFYWHCYDCDSDYPIMNSCGPEKFKFQEFAHLFHSHAISRSSIVKRSHAYCITLQYMFSNISNE